MVLPRNLGTHSLHWKLLPGAALRRATPVGLGTGTECPCPNCWGLSLQVAQPWASPVWFWICSFERSYASIIYLKVLVWFSSQLLPSAVLYHQNSWVFGPSRVLQTAWQWLNRAGRAASVPTQACRPESHIKLSEHRLLLTLATSYFFQSLGELCTLLTLILVKFPCYSFPFQRVARTCNFVSPLPLLSFN